MLALFVITSMFLGTAGSSVDVTGNDIALKDNVKIEYVYNLNR